MMEPVATDRNNPPVPVRRTCSGKLGTDKILTDLIQDTMVIHARAKVGQMKGLRSYKKQPTAQQTPELSLDDALQSTEKS